MGYTAPSEDISSFPAKGKNALDAYSSYNCLFTLACLNKGQQAAKGFNSSSLTNIIASSKGDWGKANKRVVTQFGSFDYFIDEVLIVSVPTLSQQAGNSFATKISFKVFEPYSMALFYLTMQVGAQAAGYNNYREAPFLLMIEFAGYNDDRQPTIDPSLTRYIPIKFIKSKMKVQSSGTTYECEAVPYNEVALRDEFSNIRKDHTLRGATVQELLAGSGESLKSVVTRQYQEDASDSITDVPDQIDIQFPSAFTDTGNSGNVISKSKCFSDFTDGGTVKFPNQDAIFDNIKQIYQNKKVQIVEGKNFHFEQNMKIQEIITEVILRSDYITNQLINANTIFNNKGMVNWFRVEVHVEDGPFSKKFNRQTRKMIYRIVPYEVHISKLVPPTSVPPGYPEIKKTVLRVYDYIYTGNNTEIQSLELDFNMAFFSNIPSDNANRTGPNVSNSQGDAGKDPIAKINDGGGKNSSDAGTSNQTALPGTQKQTGGGSGNDNTATAQVRTLQALLTNPSDLVKITMTVLGDPYYLPSSGMGNQIVPPAGDNILRDGSMNYQNGEVDIVVNFRTPVDLDPVTGLYKFITVADEFSGLFMLTKIENKFSQNRFTQTITANRRRAQVTGATNKEIIFGQ